MMKNNYYGGKDFGQLTLDFVESINIEEFYSQAGQDIFVLSALNGKKNGKFLDIGSSDPIIINNTYLLEKFLGWSGVQIEIDESLANKCKNERLSNVINQDATTVDYDKLFEELNEIDYLSLDIDGQPCLDVLKKIPLDKYKISVITFEHDSYRVGDYLKNESRQLLKDFGYTMICGDVANENNIYEDWYVHPNLVDLKRLDPLVSYGKNWDDILFKK